MGIMIFMLKSQRRTLRWPNNLCARLYVTDDRNFRSEISKEM